MKKLATNTHLQSLRGATADAFQWQKTMTVFSDHSYNTEKMLSPKLASYSDAWIGTWLPNHDPLKDPWDEDVYLYLSFDHTKLTNHVGKHTYHTWIQWVMILFPTLGGLDMFFLNNQPLGVRGRFGVLICASVTGLKKWTMWCNYKTCNSAVTPSGKIQ